MSDGRGGFSSSLVSKSSGCSETLRDPNVSEGGARGKTKFWFTTLSYDGGGNSSLYGW